MKSDKEIIKLRAILTLLLTEDKYIFTRAYGIATDSRNKKSGAAIWYYMYEKKDNKI